MTALDVADRLSSAQVAAATTAADDVLVVAGPGSGKTSVIAARARYLMAQGEDPDRILALTFTRSAAAEIRARVDNPDVRVYTFHGLAWSVLEPHVGGLQLATWHQAEAAVRSLYAGPTRRSDRGLPQITDLREGITRYQAAGCAAPVEPAVRTVLQRLADAGLVPLWDLLPRLLAHQLRDDVGRQVGHVLVDEFQDTSELEYCIGLREGASMFAVGDPAQAIFGWRGGGWRDLPGAEHHTLGRSYRFGAEIAAEVNGIGALAGAIPIEGDPHASGSVARVPWSGLRVEVESEAAGGTLVLCRTREGCRSVAAEIGEDLCEVATRDPADPLASDSDRFAEIWARDRAVVSTVHAAKGREAERAILCLDRGREYADVEEHRVDYVAATRARSRLVFVVGGVGQE